MKYCDPKHNQIKPNPVSEPFEDNRTLASKVKKVTKILTDAQVKDQPLTREEFARKFLEKTQVNTDSFYSFCKGEISHMKKTNFARATIQSYDSYISKLKNTDRN